MPTSAELDALRQKHPGETLAIPLIARLLDDQLTPVLAYRRLVAPDEREAPSFLFESVEGGERQGRYSILGARPIIEVVGSGAGTASPRATITDHRSGSIREVVGDPLAVARDLSRTIRLVHAGIDAPAAFLAGWAGYAAYDSVRFTEPEKLASPPPDDRGLADVHFGFYDGVIVFDHVRKLVFVVSLALIGPGVDAARELARARARLEERVEEIQRHSKPLPAGRVDAGRPPSLAGPIGSNLTPEAHAAMVARALEYIRAGDIFQVVLGQRFERPSPADPFDVYRALRSVNPSPYMVYMQGPGCILVASSPEILCRVRRTPGDALVVTNRPLAGTRKRGGTAEEDAALEVELLADPKERAEHIMLVDLGRNDVGRVAEPGSIRVDPIMAVERFSHVMHISSTVSGRLRAGLDAWDALRAALPVGTISGAPKIRAMQIIDELEPVRRGPYGGGMGYIGLDGEMDIALALRTIVVPTARRAGATWVYHLQASGGIVADSRAADEHQETISKAAALARAIDLAERAFPTPPTS